MTTNGHIIEGVTSVGTTNVGTTSCTTAPHLQQNEEIKSIVECTGKNKYKTEDARAKSSLLQDCLSSK